MKAVFFNFERVKVLVGWYLLEHPFVEVIVFREHPFCLDAFQLCVQMM